TPRAAAEIRKEFAATPSLKCFRVATGVRGYSFSFEAAPHPHDFQGESQGVPILVSRYSVPRILEGSLVDYSDDPKNGGFFVSPYEPGAESLDFTTSLATARKSQKTALARRATPGVAPPLPPEGVLRLVHFDAPPGKLAAYLTPDPKDGKKH